MRIIELGTGLAGPDAVTFGVTDHDETKQYQRQLDFLRRQEALKNTKSPDPNRNPFKRLIKAWRWLYRSPDWQPHTVAHWKVDITGKPIRGNVMRRWRNEKWQYREMTSKEAREWQDMKAY